MDTWNLKGGQIKYLTNDKIEELHLASLRVLQEVGVVFEHEEALDLFEKHGASVDRAKKRVWIPPFLVEQAIKTAPERVTLAARNPRYDLLLEKQRVYFGTGTLALYVLDLETGAHRDGTLKDCFDFPRMIDALEYVHFFKAMIWPSDVPKETADLHQLYAAYASTTKQISMACFSRETAMAAVEMAEAVAGSPIEFKKRPLLTINVLSVSPLLWAHKNTDILIALAKHGNIPIIIGSAPYSGTTAPVTLAGLVVQGNAENLAGITLAQLISPGCPVLYAMIGSVSNMKTGRIASGSVELGIITAVCAQLCHYYKIPMYSTGGMSDSKCSDIQAGYEKALQAVMAALSGAHYIHDAAGLLDFCLTTSYEQYVIDDEILGMVARILHGMNTDKDALAFEVIKTVGPGGHYLAQKHTMAHLRNEHFIPRITNRQARAEWENGGRHSALEAAKETARALLDSHTPEPLPATVDTELKQILKRTEQKLGVASKTT